LLAAKQALSSWAFNSCYSPANGVPVMSKVVHSGIQKEVIKLYRLFMREARKKPAESRGPLVEMIRQKFKEKKDHPKYVASAITVTRTAGLRFWGLSSSAVQLSSNRIPWLAQLCAT
jgi:hypothetical protein